MTLDLLQLAWGAIAGHRLRSMLTALGIVIGVASVILLTALGEGTRQYVLGEFSQFGTNLLQVSPGRSTTGGTPTGILTTVRKLTIDDAQALMRVPGVLQIVCAIYGSARAEAEGRGRQVFIYGVTGEVPDVWKFRIGRGRFLPVGDPRRESPLAVLGPTVARELFAERSPLGRHVRVGDRRFLVIGVMAPKGQFLGFDIDDAVYVPVASAQRMFNQDGLMEVHVSFAPTASPEAVKRRVRAILMQRHGDREDFTVVTQTEMLDTAGRVLGMISLAVAGIGAISLLVGAIGILTIMWIAVNERTAEIGLLKAIGAGEAQVLRVFLLEAALLSAVGGLVGTVLGVTIGWLAGALFPQVRFQIPVGYSVAAVAMSIMVGLASGVLPARRAARLDPIDALHAE